MPRPNPGKKMSKSKSTDEDLGKLDARGLSPQLEDHNPSNKKTKVSVGLQTETPKEDDQAKQSDTKPEPTAGSSKDEASGFDDGKENKFEELTPEEERQQEEARRHIQEVRREIREAIDTMSEEEINLQMSINKTLLDDNLEVQKKVNAELTKAEQLIAGSKDVAKNLEDTIGEMVEISYEKKLLSMRRKHDRQVATLMKTRIGKQKSSLREGKDSIDKLEKELEASEDSESASKDSESASKDSASASKDSASASKDSASASKDSASASKDSASASKDSASASKDSASASKDSASASKDSASASKDSASASKDSASASKDSASASKDSASASKDSASASKDSASASKDSASASKDSASASKDSASASKDSAFEAKRPKVEGAGQSDSGDDTENDEELEDLDTDDSDENSSMSKMAAAFNEWQVKMGECGADIEAKLEKTKEARDNFVLEREELLEDRRRLLRRKVEWLKRKDATNVRGRCGKKFRKKK